MSMRPPVSPFRLSVSLLALALPVFFAGPTARAEQRLGVQRGAGVAPRAEKEQALARLLEVRAAIDAGADDVGDAETALHELDHAIEDLEESLAPEFWLQDDEGGIDGSRLDPDDGHHVFNRERHTAQNAFDAIRQGEIENDDLQQELLAIVDVLVAADRRLAEVAIADAEAADGDADEIDEASEHLEEGDELVAEAAKQTRLSGKAAKLYEAMDGSYRHAWTNAIDAVDD